ncbi:MAG: histidine kinase [Gemmatimonadota bacterium]
MADPGIPRSRREKFALLVGVWTLIGLLHFSYLYLDDLTRGKPGTAPGRFIDEFAGAYGAALMFPAILWWIRRYRLDRTHWLRRLPAQLGGMVVVSLVHTTWNAVSRPLLYRLSGLPAYDYGNLAIRYLMELPNDALNYAILVGLVGLYDYYRENRTRELRTAQLEASLARSQLQNLRLQLNPHFLFNALNTISSIMYEDPVRADQMLARLSELLRATLQAPEGQETTVEQELHVLSLYLELMRARFEERLEVKVVAEAGVHGALLPQLLLQPLVENALRHGLDLSGRGTVEVNCARANGNLHLEVRDHGPGLAGAIREGIGLSNTVARLDRLYGTAQRFEISNADGGGLRISIDIPYHTVPVPS